MIRRAVAALLRRAGYVAFHQKWLPGAEIAEFETMLAAIQPYTMVAREGLLALYLQARHCEETGLVGAFVECGVWKGGAVGLMAQVNLRHGQTRRALHLFDAFQDICAPDQAVDGALAVAQAKAWSKEGLIQGELRPLTGFYAHRGGPGTVEQNRQLLVDTLGYDPAHLHLHAGWFQDTLPVARAAVGPIALLRLDGDWYASTKVCLDNLFDQVVPGGMVTFDDYGAYEGCRKAVDEFFAARGRRPYLHYINRDIRTLVVP
jgi:O-methyltransferase